MGHEESSATERPSSILRIRDFRLLWAGETISVFGTQFNIIALQWLVLQIAGSGLLLGTVLMVAAMPRAVLMIAGGAVADREPPRRVLIVSNFVRAAVVAALAVLAASSSAPVAPLLLLVLLFGVADAFFYPAYMGLVPRLVGPAKLAPANSLLQGSAQVMGLAGPAMAGFVIAAWGTATAFSIDSLTFAVAGAAALAMTSSSSRSAPDRTGRPNILASIGQGLRYAWNDRLIRSLLLLTAAANVAFVGPYVIGTALMADEMFGSVSSLGIMLAASAAGALLGTTVAGLWTVPRQGLFMLSLPAVAGIGIAALSFVSELLEAAVLRALIGVAVGFINVLALSLLQRRVEAAMMGRTMSLVMFMSFGLHPLSYLAAGLLAQLGMETLFVSAGALLLLASIGASASRELRELD